MSVRSDWSINQRFVWWYSVGHASRIEMLGMRRVKKVVDKGVGMQPPFGTQCGSSPKTTTYRGRKTGKGAEQPAKQKNTHVTHERQQFLEETLAGTTRSKSGKKMPGASPRRVLKKQMIYQVTRGNISLQTKTSSGPQPGRDH